MARLSFLLILCIVFLQSFVVSSKKCPPACDCLGAIVDCSDNELNEIPGDMPQWVEELYLSKNPSLQFNNESLRNLPRLSTLALDDFQLKAFPHLGDLPTLKVLSLSGNKLHRSDSTWAKGLPSLSELNLSRNRFRNFSLAKLSSNISLRKIDLENNAISSIVPSRPEASFPSLSVLRLAKNQIDDAAFKNLSVLFDALPNLTTLDLNRNQIRNLGALKFKNLTNLTELKLKRNKLEGLPDGVFYGLRSLRTLRVDHNANINEVSVGWLFEQKLLKVLSLSHNKVSVIKEKVWLTTTSLTVLDISFNRLGCNHPEPSFKTLSSIKKLILSHNCLATLDKNTFGELSKLEILDLSYNQLQWSIEDDTGVFLGLKSLLSLNLAYNKIETIHGKVLLPLSSLTSLDLSGNHLKTLPENPFKNMIQLSKLYFNTSSVVCDCHLAWLPEWLGTQSFNSVKSSCGYPKDLEGTSIFLLEKEDFRCDVSPQPIISEYPMNQTALYGENMTLECVAYTGGEKPNFIWTKDRKVVEPFRIKTFMSVSEEKDNGTVYKVVSRLFVDNVTYYDSGAYQCIARNSYGPSYSPPADVIVHRFPFFTEEFVSVEVKEGGVVKFKCAASGYPAPEILLDKEGFFPAPRESRLFFLSNMYHIKPVLPQDGGVYICMARNKAGAINVTAKVSVIYTPNFTRPLYNQAATLGQSIALECQGTGYPKPKVTWYKNDELVSPNQNRVLVENGQFLLLLKVEAEDIGSYCCELTNTLGTQRREINLTLKQDIIIPAMIALIVMMMVVCVVLTSLFWVFIIYKMRKRTERTHLRQVVGTLYPPSLPPTFPADGMVTAVGQDSGSEHSSGKDSGVGESAQRSNEDLHPLNAESKAVLRRSLLIYPDSPNGLGVKGHPMLTQNRVPSEEMRPRLSTFGMQHLDPNRAGGAYPNTYASLRRGSASRLLPVPSPVTPGMGVNSLPRHAYRAHSNSLSQYKSAHDRCSSLSRRRPSRPDTPPPVGVTDRDECHQPNGSVGGGRDFRSINVVNDFPKSTPTPAPTYYTFRSPEKNAKNKAALTGGTAPTHLMPAR